MKGLGAVLMLGMILLSMLAFASWLRTPHRLVSQWPASADRDLEQVDGLAGLASPHR